MSLRAFLFWCHLVAGVFAGAVILVMSVTGVLLTYERQMLAWADTRGLEIAAPAGGTRLPVEEIVARVRAAGPDTSLTAVAVSADMAKPVAISAGPRTLQVHPYTGEVLGEGAVGLRRFFRWVTDWHRWLAMGGDSRPTGRAITGASNLAFLFIVSSGFFLWWPRILKWTAVRQVLLFRGGLRGKARDFNWHNVIGFWSAVPLFIVVLGGVVISYPWASDLVYAAFGEAPPPRQRPGGGPGAGADARNAGGERRRDAAEPIVAGIDRAIAAAIIREPAWRTVNVRLPMTEQQPLNVTVDTGTGGQPQRRVTIVVDRVTGNVEREELFASQSAGRRARLWLRFAHTGEVYGLPGQTIAGAVSLGGSVLVWTGIALALRRLFAWRARTKKRQVLEAA
jgi:uncharacterized iron-regulated membrane protein